MRQRIGWFVHNCIAHPVAGVCWLLGFTRLGDKIHDDSTPKGR